MLINNYKLAKCHQGKVQGIITWEPGLVRVAGGGWGTPGHRKQPGTTSLQPELAVVGPSCSL